jgi:hypothetical protein
MGKHSKPEDNTWQRILQIAEQHRTNLCGCTSSFKSSNFTERFPVPQVIYPQIHVELLELLEMDYPDWSFRNAFRERWFPYLEPEPRPRSVVTSGPLEILSIMRGKS